MGCWGLLGWWHYWWFWIIPENILRNIWWIFQQTMFLFSTATFDKGYPNVHHEFSAIRWWDNRWPLCYEIKQHILWTNVVKTIVQHHISNGLYQPFMVILGMVYYCLNHIIWTYDVSVLNIMGYFTHLLWSMVYDSLWWFMFFSFHAICILFMDI